MVRARCLQGGMSALLRLNSPSITFNMATTNSKLKAAILVVSETASEDPSTDKCIPILRKVFGDLGNDQWEVSETEIVPDNALAIQKTIRSWTDGPEPINLVVTSGGTGFATKDVTPEVRDQCSRCFRVRS
jgi:gephyrin